VNIFGKLYQPNFSTSLNTLKHIKMLNEGLVERPLPNGTASLTENTTVEEQPLDTLKSVAASQVPRDFLMHDGHPDVQLLCSGILLTANKYSTFGSFCPQESMM
jgi:hypothetical protein